MNKEFEQEWLKEEGNLKLKVKYTKMFKETLTKEIKSYNKRMDLVIDDNKHIKVKKCIMQTAVIQDDDLKPIMVFGLQCQQLHVNLKLQLELSDVNKETINQICAGSITRLAWRHTRVQKGVSLEGYDGSKIYNGFVDMVKQAEEKANGSEVSEI